MFDIKLGTRAQPEARAAVWNGDLKRNQLTQRLEYAGLAHEQGVHSYSLRGNSPGGSISQFKVQKPREDVVQHKTYANSRINIDII